MPTDPWEVHRGALSPDSLALPANVYAEQGVFEPAPLSGDEIAALVQGRQEEDARQELLANRKLIYGFMAALPQPPHDGLPCPGIAAESLSQAKMLQRFLIFDNGPFYLLGRRVGQK